MKFKYCLNYLGRLNIFGQSMMITYFFSLCLHNISTRTGIKTCKVTISKQWFKAVFFHKKFWQKTHFGKIRTFALQLQFRIENEMSRKKRFLFPKNGPHFFTWAQTLSSHDISFFDALCYWIKVPFFLKMCHFIGIHFYLVIIFIFSVFFSNV